MHRYIRLIGTVLPVIFAAQVSADTLVWSDEFDGPNIDTSKWEFMIGDGTNYGNPGWGNNELQYYTSRTENAFISDGKLHIVARAESFGGKNYTSARMRTRNNGDFLYGRIEGRIKLPSTPGIWPAFWMLPTNSPYGGWAASGEIDIMESVNYADRIYGTIHYGGQWPNNTHTGGERTGGIDYSADFHTYSIEWTPQFIRWYVDGQAYYTRVAANWFSSNAPDDENAPFDQPFHILINVAVGGNFPGNPNGNSVFPQEMQIDWIRVYQDIPEQEPYLSSPSSIPGQIEAENYDLGGPGLAYNDCDTNNNGDSYRTAEGVDLEPCSEGGFNVGWMCEGEWLEYTVDVADTASYLFEARVASEQSGGLFQVEFEGQDVTGNLTFPATGGWQNWTTVSTEVVLSAGQQVMRFVNNGTTQSYNLNWFRFTSLCTKGDVNNDGTINAVDIAPFVETIMSPGSASATEICASDVDGNGEVDSIDDINGFVSLLIQ